MTQMVDHFKEAMRLLIAAPIHLKGSFYGKKFSNGTLVVHENIKTADCFCAAGALYRVLDRDVVNAGSSLPQEYVEALGFKSEGGIYNWNDKSDKNEVLTRISVLHRAQEM